ncbi:MAG: hypothetical protein BJ554DRAFT_6225, partial [Olpidium bornovanus]
MDDHNLALRAYESALRHNPHSIPALSQLAALCRTTERFDKAVEYFNRLLNVDNTKGEIWGALGHWCVLFACDQNAAGMPAVYFGAVPAEDLEEHRKDPIAAKDAYERVLSQNPAHAKVLQQLGWLYSQAKAPFRNQDTAIQYLTRSLNVDPNDAQSWYLLG